MPFPKYVGKLENLQRAWQWIRSNPDRFYKSHFREVYSAYATADGELLKNLKNRLDRNIYTPSDSCKIFLPKPSGILRPYTLLCVEDQIVYQAMANIVAEKLYPIVRSRYNKQVFGHMYAGKRNLWFYQKWTNGYGAFNAASKQAFDAGYVWTASFDLTAFYDSIDHNVLRYMLGKLNIDYDFSESLTRLLNQWTSTGTPIYHDHGIPQGPLSSGIISESVLNHFDENFSSRNDIKYLRYVDDIRLYAKNEDHLRAALVSLDRISKDIGLFPQSGKIDIHRVIDIDKELKTISMPFEFSSSLGVVNQREVTSELLALSTRQGGYRVEDPTKFKMLIAISGPSLRILDRVWRVFERSPIYYTQLSRYMTKFKKLPDTYSEKLLDQIVRQNIYPSIRASFISCASSKQMPSKVGKLKAILKPLWSPKFNAPELTVALWNALIHLGHITERQANYALLNAHIPWVKMKLYFGTPWFDIEEKRRNRLLNAGMRDKNSDVAISSAWIASLLDCEVERPLRTVNHLAKIVLRESGQLKRVNAKVCGIDLAITEMLGVSSGINWKKFFGRRYHLAESKLVACKGYFKTNPTAWVSMLDVFNDVLIDEIIKKDGTFGIRKLGKFGPIYSNGLALKYPALYQYIVAVHGKRGESEFSHAVVEKTQAPTGRISYKWLPKGIKLMKAALEEIRLSNFK